MDGIEEIVAQNLTRLRKERRVSLSELARRSSLAKATLSGLESGSGNPTIQTLWSLADALGCSLGDLIADSTPQLLHDGEGVWVRGDATRGRLLARLFGAGGVDVHEVTYLADRAHASQGHSASATEYLYVISGELDAGPTGEVVRLGPGDLIRFSVDKPYSIRAVGDDAKALVFIASDDRMSFPSAFGDAKPRQRSGPRGAPKGTSPPTDGRGRQAAPPR